ncbi:MAG: ABC transporter substrate-binding protein, partial [Syntrophorhabdus sp.]
AFFKKHKIAVNVVPQSYSINLFLRDGVDAASAMWYNEYHSMLNAGINADELTTFAYSDYGLNFPEDGLYVMDELVKKDPASVCNFVRASIEGWKYSFDHPDKAIEIILKYMTEAKVPANKAHQKWMLDRMKDIIMEPAVSPGTLKKEDYDRVGWELKESGLIREIPDIKSFSFTCGDNVQK